MKQLVDFKSTVDFTDTIKNQFRLSTNDKQRDFVRPLRFFVVNNPYDCCPCLDNAVCVVYFDVEDKRLYYQTMSKYDAMSSGFFTSLFMKVFLEPKIYFEALQEFFVNTDFQILFGHSLSLTELNINVDDDFKDDYSADCDNLLDYVKIFKDTAVLTSDLAELIMTTYYSMRGIILNILKFSKVF